MIEIKNLTKSFGTKKITRGLDLTIQDNDFLAIIGRSGEGKSVLLKQIIGLIKPDSGEIIIDNQNIANLTKVELEAVYKKCGYVFQFAALLDSLNVLENVGITLLENNVSPEEVIPLVTEKLKSVGLGQDVLYKYPSELSGGMKKRVGLARTLMLSPKILIYDEPTTGLDPITVKLIHELIQQTHERLNATTIVISHDIEIFKYAKTVAMLHEGKIIYTGATKDIWECKNPYIYQFIRGLEYGPITNNEIIEKHK
ncbi:MAG: ABC transporter-like protein [candidate division TM6 bacterium GW2011_GWF2_28_16]|nr:MAG: ABC transporter-like protein [candidate division TM6 bacterium GW2011_GWF2_28_16]